MPSGRRSKQPDWPTMLRSDWAEWLAAVRLAADGPRVLIATGTGGQLGMTHVESTLAIALTLRGARVSILLCDHALPACQEAAKDQNISEQEMAVIGPSLSLCIGCFRPAKRMFSELGLPVLTYSEFLTGADILESQQTALRLPMAEARAFCEQGVAIGEHAMAGALRFYKRGDLHGEAQQEVIVRRYLAAALLTSRAVTRLLQTEAYDALCVHHGIYVPQGVVVEAARRRGVRVVTWNPAYRRGCFIFSHGDTYHHTLMAEPTSNWDDMTWTPEMEAAILAYLKSRWHGSRDWVWFQHEHPEEDINRVAHDMRLDPHLPLIGLLTNVVWDAQLHYPANAFENMIDWIVQTIRYFEHRTDLQLVVRVHPAELKAVMKSRQLVEDEIRQAFPVLPPNVHIVGPAEKISTYALMSACDTAIIYGTKTGVELTSMGIPVIVAGEAWIRGKGLTRDASSVADYLQLLDSLPAGRRLDAETMQRARMYAFHFFFRRMIPLDMMAADESGELLYQAKPDGLHALKPGASLGLDTVCNGILNGTEFIYPAEKHVDAIR